MQGLEGEAAARSAQVGGWSSEVRTVTDCVTGSRLHSSTDNPHAYRFEDDVGSPILYSAVQSHYTGNSGLKLL